MYNTYMIQTCWKCGKDHNVKNKLYGLERCPSCNIIAFHKTYDEGFLQDCQEKFLSSREEARLNGEYEVLHDPKSGRTYRLPPGDNKYLDLMFPTLLSYSIKIVRQKTVNVNLPSDKVEESALITVGTMIRYFKTKEDFKISASFGSYLKDISLLPLFDKKEQKRQKAEQSLNALVGGEEGTELEDVIYKYAPSLAVTEEILDYNIYKKEAIKEVISVVKLMLKSMKLQQGTEDYIILLKAFILEMDEDVHPKKRTVFWDKYRYNSSGESRQDLFEKAKFLLMEGLKSSLKGDSMDYRSKNILNGLLQTKRNKHYY